MQFDSFNNATEGDLTFRRLEREAHLGLSQRYDYSLEQRIGNADLQFEFWEAIMHPGAKGSATFSFNYPVDVYFAARYDTDGQDHDPDYEQHYVEKWPGLMNGTVYAPKINASGTWAFVFEKDFKLQAQTKGNVSYTYHMVEYEIPKTEPNDTLVGYGRFCWDYGHSNYSWFLNAAWNNGTVNVTNPLAAQITCVPRYHLTVPIMCIPVGILRKILFFFSPFFFF